MSVMVSPRGQHRAPRTGGRLTSERARGRTRAGVVAVSMLVSLFVAGPAHAEVVNTTVSTFPTQTTLGDTNVDFTITVSNISTPPDDDITLQLIEAGVTPSCAQFSGTGVCTTPELDVFLLREGAAAAVGVAGSCVGDTFTVSPRDGTGRHTITPEQPTFLGPSDGSGPLPPQCTMVLRILEVNRVPTIDVAPATDGVQTRSSVDSLVLDPGTGRESGHFRTELVTVFPGQVILETVSDPNRVDGPNPVPPGSTATDTATVTRADPGANPDPEGTVTFTLVGPDPDANCTGPVAHGPETVPIDPATGEATSSQTAPLTEAGVYNWVATFESADQNYEDIVDPVGCGDPLEMFDVQPAPTIDVVKTADPETQPAPTGTFTFDVEVTNTGVNPVTITALTDDIYGDLNDPDNPNVANNTCAGAVGTPLAPGETFTCSFDGDFTGAPGEQQTDVVTATAEDDFGQEAQADDDAVVGLVLPAPPEIAVDKTADPLEQPAPGGDFTFTVVVTNTGPSRVTITELDDDIYGDLNDLMNPNVTDNTCEGAVGTELDPGESFTCSFVGEFTGNEGDSQTDVVTAVAEDQFGQEAVAEDDAVVTLGPPPMIQVDKTVDPEQRPTPGGTFSYTVVVTNNSATLPLAITELDDDQYGDLNDPDNPDVENNTCAGIVGTVLQPDESVTCTFDAEFLGGAGDSHTNIVTVEGEDQFGNVVTDDDDATVAIVGIPEVELDKSADPESLPTPGGTFTFTVVISNIGPDAFTIIDLDDDIYGDLNDPDNPNVENNTCAGVVGLRLEPGESHTCTFDGEFTGTAGDEEIDTITVVVETDDGVREDDEDDAVVIITGEPDVAVDKTVDPASLPEPGGTFTYTVVVTNTSLDPVTITSLTDDIYGDLDDPDNDLVDNNTCLDAVGTGLAPSPGPGHTFTCTFDGVFTGVAGDTETDTVTVVVEDATGQEATDSDDATVTLDPPPVIQVVKTVDPASLPAPGGTFGYTVVVTNNAVTPLEITSLEDDQYGDLNDPDNPDVENNTCAGIVGTVLDPGESVTCTFDADFTGAEGDSHTNVVTVVGEDPDGTEVTDDDDAVVTIGPGGDVIPDEPPVIGVDKTASPTQLPVPGGEFTFTLTVTNPGVSPVTITSLVDDIHGDLDGQGTCAVGATLAAEGGTYTCQFTATFTGEAGDTETDVIIVVAEDEQGREAEDEDDATITIVPVDEPPPPPVVEPPPPPAVPTPAGKLPVTGLDLMPLVAVAGALLTLGAMLVAKTPATGRHARRGHRPRHRRRRDSRWPSWALR